MTPRQRVAAGSGASLWAVEARASDGRNYPNPARERIVEDVSRMSGGMREYVSTAAALDSLSRLMGDLVASQYAITFAGGPDEHRQQTDRGREADRSVRDGADLAARRQ